MGIETIVILGLTALKAHSQLSAAEDEAKAIQEDAANRAKFDVAQAEAAAEEGSLAAKNKAQQVALKAASQQASFLNSGLTLSGTPKSVIQGTFDTGIEDTALILKNASRTSNNFITRANNTIQSGQNSAKAALSAGRSQALSTIASGVGGASFASGSFSGSGTFGSQGVVSRTIEFGNPAAQGPIQGFGGFGG